MSEKRKGIIIYLDYEEQFETLSDREMGELIRAALAYVKRGEEPDFPPALQLAFSVMRAALDRDEEKYQRTCERNREYALKRWESKD